MQREKMSIAQQLYDYAKKFCDKGDGYNNAEKRAIDDWIKQKRFKIVLKSYYYILLEKVITMWRRQSHF